MSLSLGNNNFKHEFNDLLEIYNKPEQQLQSNNLTTETIQDQTQGSQNGAKQRMEWSNPQNQRAENKNQRADNVYQSRHRKVKLQYK